MFLDYEPFSLVDYPGHIAATVFFSGCNFVCGYCQNPILVKNEEKPNASPQEFLDFLQTRIGLLEGVCFTGGEPLLAKELPLLATGIKELGFRVKLDTNGSLPQRLKEVGFLMDYIAMDVKTIPERYDELTGCKNSWEKVKESAEWLKQQNIPHEFRTTVLPEWVSAEDLKTIRAFLGEEETWVLQQFREPPGGVLDGKEHKPYPDFWLKEMADKLNCKTRSLNL